MEYSKKIEIFKIFQRAVMMILTCVMIYVMYIGINNLTVEIKAMRIELTNANTTITEMAKCTQNVAKEIDDLEKVISNNWMYKLFGGKK